MQTLNVLLQLLQPDIASTRSWLSSMPNLTTFVPGADRLENARGGVVWGLLRLCGMKSALGVECVCLCTCPHSCI